MLLRWSRIALLFLGAIKRLERDCFGDDSFINTARGFGAERWFAVGHRIAQHFFLSSFGGSGWDVCLLANASNVQGDFSAFIEQGNDLFIYRVNSFAMLRDGFGGRLRRLGLTSCQRCCCENQEEAKNPFHKRFALIRCCMFVVAFRDFAVQPRSGCFPLPDKRGDADP